MKRRHVFFPALAAAMVAVAIGASSAFAENATLKFNPQTGELLYETFPAGLNPQQSSGLRAGRFPGYEGNRLHRDR